MGLCKIDLYKDQKAEFWGTLLALGAFIGLLIVTGVVR